ncbi:DNA-(apurinic or apyrimidinic site) lyase [Formivibrio citricus]|uniref:Formamidopyrimidine-DNA glycosylase n=1 Tax=Formivibrio citricus TaxID=83765 RepID=A0A1I5DEM3_9NEIS|nr:bifunctional DNA-formamidopyrimidine glycosylase/DNA-(apurinic or apyrimidinic site) lyase [Formivibrio citricus]SFN97714.1 DNA-(apurinic or apyrimidinic site) lyase [Formivibrio citricus]
MPELPEVETTRRGIAGRLTGAAICEVIVRNPKLRWPVPGNLDEILAGQTLQAIERRAKYLLFRFKHGTLIVHLGMSGSLRVLSTDTPVEKHEHIDLVFSNGQRLRYRDPRRFGAFQWTVEPPEKHPLLCKLAPEPLSGEFNTDYLAKALAGKKIAIKPAIMDQHLVVGVGNIYASEALFRAGIVPQRPANRLSAEEILRLVDAIRAVLKEAIAAGGSTLRDYVDSDGNAGYFTVNSYVYGLAGKPCRVCGSPIQTLRQGQRATFWCPHCQH